MSAKPRPQFATFNLPKPDDKSIEEFTKERGVPVLTTPTAPKGPTAPGHFVRLDVPDYLARAMRVEAAKRGCTLRYLTLKALKADGWTVNDEDIGEGPRRQITRA